MEDLQGNPAKGWLMAGRIQGCDLDVVPALWADCVALAAPRTHQPLSSRALVERSLHVGRDDLND